MKPIFIGNKTYRVHTCRPQITLIACMHCEGGISMHFWNPNITTSFILIDYDNSIQFKWFTIFPTKWSRATKYSWWVSIYQDCSAKNAPPHTHGLGNVQHDSQILSGLGYVGLLIYIRGHKREAFENLWLSPSGQRKGCSWSHPW